MKKKIFLAAIRGTLFDWFMTVICMLLIVGCIALVIQFPTIALTIVAIVFFFYCVIDKYDEIKGSFDE